MNRLIGQLNLNYNFLEDFNLSYKIGTDYFREFDKRITGEGSLIPTRQNGAISQYEKESRRTTSNLILRYNKDLTEDFNVDVMAGNMIILKSYKQYQNLDMKEQIY